MASKKNGYGVPQINYIWKDKKRFLGMPLSFTRYRLSEDRLFLEKGFLNTRCDEILLYRVRDISLTISFGQKLCGVGTVAVDSSDQTMPRLNLKNVKKPREVKELIHRQVEAAKLAYRVRVSELMSDPSAMADSDNDGIPDYLDFQN